MAKVFSVSDEFWRLCTNVDMYPHSIDVTLIHVLRCCTPLRWFDCELLRTFKCAIFFSFTRSMFLVFCKYYLCLSVYRSGE